MQYLVTASALRLRSEPSTSSARIDTVLKGAVLTSVDAPSITPGWLKVVWNGIAGYCSAQYLEPVNPATSLPDSGGAQPAAPVAAPPVEQRDRDLANVHPIVRAALNDLLGDLKVEGLPFKIFEAFRTPERQAWLYAQGRTAPGKLVTKAAPWQSMHQYGLAADLVLFVDGKWSWDGEPVMWDTMHKLAKARGLQYLSFETPHVEIAQADWRAYQGGNFPPDGDDTWYDAVMDAALRWKMSGKQPLGPDPRAIERPPLNDQTV